MSGNSILKDGISVIESYGPHLDKLREDDCVGVVRTSRVNIASLAIYFNAKTRLRIFIK